MEETGFTEVALRLRPGEWTSYGDIAAAAGRPRAARAVGREAANDDEFPNAHRVLRHDGSIARGSEARRARVKALLEAEGIGFSESNRADPAAHIYWDELQRRAGR